MKDVEQTSIQQRQSVTHLRKGFIEVLIGLGHPLTQKSPVTWESNFVWSHPHWQTRLHRLYRGFHILHINRQESSPSPAWFTYISLSTNTT